MLTVHVTYSCTPGTALVARSFAGVTLSQFHRATATGFPSGGRPVEWLDKRVRSGWPLLPSEQADSESEKKGVKVGPWPGEMRPGEPSGNMTSQMTQQPVTPESRQLASRHKFPWDRQASLVSSSDSVPSP
ncbi:unnamed protein product [Protopolystoma xenopodis]|uniref:Uncharacterized protein n=1 Tax=Protopolystoma xenopodis TaxID=117903 RepID=A0A448WH02_9PLAT|nr:unnamed protein product [Protopolystoma xenopodis]